MKARTKSNVAEVICEATIRRADGRVEHLGKISYYHRNPLKRLAHRAKKRLRKRG